MMHTRPTLLYALALFGVTLAARPCGPDFPSAVFVLQTGPGGNYASYAAGRIGVPQSAYRTRHMILAYTYLSGHPLSSDVQKEAVALNSYFLRPWQVDDVDKPRQGLAAWISARASFGPVDGYTPSAQLATDRPLPGQDYYGSFNNCLEDAFVTAAGTLNARIAAHSAKDAAVIDWVRGQDAVFTNCGDGKAPRYFGPPDKAPAPPPAAHAPAAAPADAPRWLKQDRDYQMAAASFYRMDFEDAAKRFRAISADTSSPWSITSRYLIARAYTRKASLEDGDITTPAGKDKAATAARYKGNMVLAQHELVAMQAEPRMATLRTAIDGLLDYVNLRLQPQQQAAVLAGRLQMNDAPAYRQAVVDLTWLHSTRDGSDAPVPALSSAGHPNDMLAWIDAFYGKNESAALEHWHSTRSAPWLVAALANARAGDPAVPELQQAARSFPQSNPGWLAVTYHRLRLSPQDAGVRKEALAVLPQLEASGDVSATNLFLALSAATAPGLDAWLMAAPRTPAGTSSYEDGEDVSPSASAAGTDDAAQGAQPAYVEDDCGKRFPPNTVLPLFDTDAAVVLNRDMPLRMLAQAAESPALPQNLRFQVAQATWTRAVLLEKPEIARRMTPILVGCRAAWKPVLAAYDAATTPDERQASGLLALMRFASTVPSVWEGEDRRSGFATYDEFRQNWWCTTVPKPGESVDNDPDRPTDTTPASKVNVPPVPPFLTRDDLAEAHAQVAALEQVPRASTYLAQRALAWQRLHPADPQTPDILGEADRVVRNGCRRDPPYDQAGKTQVDPADMTLTSNLARTLFETLHRNYPNSTWAKRYKSWQ